jgi:hypothetical protein
MIGPVGMQTPDSAPRRREPEARIARLIDFHVIEATTTAALITAWDDWRLDADNEKLKIYQMRAEYCADPANVWCIYVFYSK